MTCDVISDAIVGSVHDACAWASSKTGHFSLTAATRCNPDFSVSFNKTRLLRETVYDFSAGSATGAGAIQRVHASTRQLANNNVRTMLRKNSSPLFAYLVRAIPTHVEPAAA